jgi:hypothetical protein
MILAVRHARRDAQRYFLTATIEAWREATSSSASFDPGMK